MIEEQVFQLASTMIKSYIGTHGPEFEDLTPEDYSKHFLNSFDVMLKSASQYISYKREESQGLSYKQGESLSAQTQKFI